MVNLKLKFKILEKYRYQADFADEVGTDEATLSRVLRGRRKLNDNQKKKWANILDCHVSEIFE